MATLSQAGPGRVFTWAKRRRTGPATPRGTLSRVARCCGDAGVNIVGSAALGDDELALMTTADNRAVLPLVLGPGMRGRIRLSGSELHVRLPVRDFTPTRG